MGEERALDEGSEAPDCWSCSVETLDLSDPQFPQLSNADDDTYPPRIIKRVT